MNFKAFIFDLDGTVFDTSLDLAAAVNRMRIYYDLETLDTQTIVSHLGDGAFKLVERSLKGTLIDPHTAVKVFLDFYDEDICIKTDFYPGMREFLEELKERNLPAGILTNKPQDPTDKLIDTLGVRDLFQFAYGPDNFGKKPDPNGLNECVKILGLPKDQVLMIGDHHTDLYAANDAGVKNVYVTYGFGRIGESRVDYKIDKCEELFKFL